MNSLPLGTQLYCRGCGEPLENQRRFFHPDCFQRDKARPSWRQRITRHCAVTHDLSSYKRGKADSWHTSFRATIISNHSHDAGVHGSDEETKCQALLTNSRLLKTLCGERPREPSAILLVTPHSALVFGILSLVLAFCAFCSSLVTCHCSSHSSPFFTPKSVVPRVEPFIPWPLIRRTRPRSTPGPTAAGSLRRPTGVRIGPPATPA